MKGRGGERDCEEKGTEKVVNREGRRRGRGTGEEGEGK